MSIDLQQITDDPRLYLYNFHNEFAQLLTMPREAFARSIFLDERIDHGKRQLYRAPAEALLENYRAPPVESRRIGWIFHVAQCGSTLLARALDHPGRSLVLREPQALRQLGVIAGADSNRPEVIRNARFHRMLEVTVSLLGKRFEAGTPVIAKANVPVNFILEEVLSFDPVAPAIVQYFTLADYLPAVMRTEGHQGWVNSIFDELRMAGHPAVFADVPESTAAMAAALWFAQVTAFAGAQARFNQVVSLDATQFFAEPAAAIAAAAALFGLELQPGEAEALAAGDLFQTYGKNPALDYDAEVRVAREMEARKRLADEIEEAREWVMRAQQRFSLADALVRPLIGTAPPLLG